MMANVHQQATGLVYGGVVRLPPGRYEIVDIEELDSVRGTIYVTGPDGEHIGLDRENPNITIEQ